MSGNEETGPSMLGVGNHLFGEKRKPLCVFAEMMEPLDLLFSQLSMLSATVLSGDGRDERDAAGAAVCVPLFCQ